MRPGTTFIHPSASTTLAALPCMHGPSPAAAAAPTGPHSASALTPNSTHCCAPPLCSVGTKVMKDRDGKPTRRDTLFLQEMKLAEPRVAARIEARQQAGGLLLGGSMPCSSYDTPCDPLQEAAVTFYSEAVATGVYGHSVHVSGGYVCAHQCTAPPITQLTTSHVLLPPAGSLPFLLPLLCDSGSDLHRLSASATDALSSLRRT